MVTAKKYLQISGIALLALIVLFGVGAAHAQQQAGIQIKPAMIEERVEPGQEYPFTLSVANIGSETDTFYFTKRDISGIGEDGHPILAEENQEETGFEASSWISVGQESVTVPAGQERSVPITIRVPSDTVRGGYFASILVTTNPPQLQGVGTAVAYGASTVVALRVGGSAGQAVEDVNIIEFRTDKALYGKPEVIFITKVGNVGNVLVRARGPLEITDMFGKKVASLVVNPTASAILPRAERTFETSWEGGGLVFGRYQAVVSLGYGEDEKQTVSETLSFWILPRNIIVPFLVAIVGLIAGLYILTKLHIRRKLRGMNLPTGSRPLARDKGPVSRSVLVFAVFLACTLIFLLVLFVFFA